MNDAKIQSPDAVPGLSSSKEDRSVFPVPTGGKSVRRAKETEIWVIVSILTTSACLHLLAFGIFGALQPQHLWDFPVGPLKRQPIEVQLIDPPPAAPTEVLPVDSPASPAPAEVVSAPPLALRPVTVDSLPPEEPAPALAAVPSFADADLSGARDRVSEGVAPRSSSGSLAQGTASREPVLLTSGNGGLGKNLILPPVRYPREALVARLTGKVIIEFRTGASGEIADARVRASSGSSLLDRTALDNLKQGRWLGGPGFYLMKPYEFALEN